MEIRTTAKESTQVSRPKNLEGSSARKESEKSQATEVRTSATSNSLERLESVDKPSYASKIMSVLFRTPKVPTPPKTMLAPELDENNRVKVKTEDGYTIRFSGEKQEWTITTPQNTTTKIWGDPHVDESDGDRWDFSDTSTFFFGNNEVLVETTPAWNGTTFSETVTIMNGEDRITVTDIDADKPKITEWKLDRTQFDNSTPDGPGYRLELNGAKGENWEKMV